jgi:hypothetical protein
MGLTGLVLAVCAAHFVLGIVGFVWLRIRHW